MRKIWEKFNPQEKFITLAGGLAILICSLLALNALSKINFRDKLNDKKMAIPISTRETQPIVAKLSPDGKKIAIGGFLFSLNGGNRGKDYLYLTCSPLNHITPNNLARFIGRPKGVYDSFRISSVTFSKDGRLLVAGGGENTNQSSGTIGQGFIGIWDTTTRKLVKQLANTFEVKQTAVSPDGKLIATAEDDLQGRFCLYDMKSGRKIWQYHPDTPMLIDANFVSFSPDNQFLIIGGQFYPTEEQFSSAKAWVNCINLKTKKVSQIRPISMTVCSVDFSKENNQAIFSLEDRVEIRRLPDLRIIKVIALNQPLSWIVSDAAFSRDSSHIATIGQGLDKFGIHTTRVSIFGPSGLEKSINYPDREYQILKLTSKRLLLGHINIHNGKFKIITVPFNKPA